VDDQQIDRIKGLFFGQAIGDALGLGTEFMSKAQVYDNYPDGLTDYGQIIQDKHRSRWPKGAWTDDTDQFLCICDSILKERSVSETSFAIKLLEWSLGEPMGIGMTVYKVVNLPQFTQFPHRAAELIWKMSGKKGAANGAIMRTSILGAWEFWDIEKVSANTEKIAKVTHYDPRCVGSSVIITDLIAKMLTGSIPSIDEIISIGEQYDERIRPYVEISLIEDIAALQLDEKGAMGYTLKTLSAALWVYFHADSFFDGLQKVMLQGGDADTNAAVAGSLLGVKFGYEAMPSQLIAGLENRDFLEEKLKEFILCVEESIDANVKK